ncbi:hypothetical protein BDQ12DRAFT_680167 [Crucibulum laeve]|uniref:Zinc-finger domain-containing protein n=1 Tax=Crucibulum laeve TaxID=68775 RepID=A0A5C3MAP6_9AGAR|nr:hypothetical protein BDQ12DRAFT_680167 [Crucibulum laeve]
MNPPSRSSTREEQQQQQQEGSKDIIVDVDSTSSTSTQIQQATQSIHPEQDGKLAPSTEVKSGEDYATYASPFELYPFLRYRSRPMSSDRLATNSQASPSTSTSVIPSTTLVSSTAQSSLPSTFPAASIYPSSLSTPSFTSQSSSSSSSVPIPDLRPLKLATSSRMLDPSKRICQYEVPGGGVCRDDHCEDLHLNRIMGSGTDVGSGVEPSDEETAEYLYNVMPSNWLTTHNVSTSNIISALREARQVRKTPMVLDERVEQALSSLGSPPPPPPPT